MKRTKLALVSLFFILMLVAVSSLSSQSRTVHALSVGSTFTNPVYPHYADPQVYFHTDGYYYYLVGGDGIYITRSGSLSAISQGIKKKVYTPPSSGGNPPCCDLWAPEMYYLNAAWYIYYAADDGNESNHRIYVLKNTSADPLQGTWTFEGKLYNPNADYWMIDPTILSLNGQLYMFTSVKNGSSNGQNIYITPLSDPLTISGNAVELSSPQYDWEKSGGNVNEAPQALVHGGKVFVTYSASSCYTDNYALGLLSASTSSNLLDPASWTKSPTPVFSSDTANGIYAPGSNTFASSPDGTENWLIYHANSFSGAGCDFTRSTRMQKFTWDSNGNPVFGSPVPLTTAQTVPSGDQGASPLVANASFEESGTQLTGWTTWIGSGSSPNFVEAGGHTGNYRLAEYSSNPYEIATYERLQDLPNGSYDVTAWVQSSGGQTKTQMELSGWDSNNDYQNTPIPTTSTWTQITSTVTVTTGQLVVGFYSKDDSGGHWIRVDDVDVSPSGPIRNAGFELGNTAWTLWPGSNGSGADAGYVEPGGHSGSFQLAEWKAASYEIAVYQKITIPNGTHTVTAWIESGGGQSRTQMELSGWDSNNTYNDIPIPAASNWTQISGTVTVSTGQLIIGFYSNASANQWIRVDDVSIQ